MQAMSAKSGIGNCPDEQKGTTHSLAFHLEQEAKFVRFVQKRFGSQDYAIKRDLLNFVDEKFNKTLTDGWMKRFLDRHETESCQVTITLQQEVRLKVALCFLDDYLTLIKRIVPNVPIELIFNLDET
jgi:hypothetical protein